MSHELSSERLVEKLEAALRDSEQARLLQAEAIRVLKERLGECVNVMTIRDSPLSFNDQMMFSQRWNSAYAQARKLLEGPMPADPIERLLTALADPKLTPGPWEVRSGAGVDCADAFVRFAHFSSSCEDSTALDGAHAEFIAACRNGVPALLERHRDALAALRGCAEAIDELSDIAQSACHGWRMMQARDDSPDWLRISDASMRAVAIRDAALAQARAVERTQQQRSSKE